MHMFSMPAMPSAPGRKFLAGVLTALALLLVLTPSVATPAGKIVIYGAHSGSTLTLSMEGGKIVVEGNMAHQEPHGCRFTDGRRVAVCSTRRVDSIEIQMSPAHDFVRVAEQMPFPLSVYLGDGSD